MYLSDWICYLDFFLQSADFFNNTVRKMKYTDSDDRQTKLLHEKCSHILNFYPQNIIVDFGYRHNSFSYCAGPYVQVNFTAVKHVKFKHDMMQRQI